MLQFGPLETSLLSAFIDMESLMIPPTKPRSLHHWIPTTNVALRYSPLSALTKLEGTNAVSTGTNLCSVPWEFPHETAQDTNNQLCGHGHRIGHFGSFDFNQNYNGTLNLPLFHEFTATTQLPPTIDFETQYTPHYEDIHTSNHSISPLDLNATNNSIECPTPNPPTQTPPSPSPSIAYRIETTRVQKFICTHHSCDKKFSRLPELRRHHRGAHEGHRPYICRTTGCRRAVVGFPRRDKRDDHERKIHGGAA